MSALCNALMAEADSSVAAALRAVDCTASEVSAAAFGRLFAPGGTLGPVLTIMLALFIAFFAIALMLGRSNLSIRSLVPRIVTMGLVITFATSWVAYQSVVWNLFVGTPDYLASVLTGTRGSATQVFADKIDIVFSAVEQASNAAGAAPAAAGEAAAATAGAPNTGAEITAFSPRGILWLGALLFLLGTVGVLVTARIALALLVALGPIFVVMGLFNSTRGLFTGWLKGLVMLGIAPLMAVLGGGIMLELAVPILAKLTLLPGEINQRAAVSFFLVGAVHVALMVMLLKVSATMVAGWRVFGLVSEAKSDPQPEFRGEAAPHVVLRQNRPMSTAEAAGLSAPPRRVMQAALATRPAANDTGGGNSGAGGRIRETRIFAASTGTGQVSPLSSAASRTRGIGNRFRSAGSRKTEKIR